MSAGAKPTGKRVLPKMKGVKRDVCSDRRESWVRKACPGRHRGARALIPALRAVSPAALLLIETGVIFDVGADHLLVMESHPSEVGPQADVLILGGSDYNGGDVRPVVRALQVRDLETLIEEGLIDIAFGPNPRDYNRSKGWSRTGAPTLASLGIYLEG